MEGHKEGLDQCSEVTPFISPQTVLDSGSCLETARQGQGDHCSTRHSEVAEPGSDLSCCPLRTFVPPDTKGSHQFSQQCIQPEYLDCQTFILSLSFSCCPA